MALNVSEYRRLYERYERGEVSEARLKAAYRSLRATVNYRIKSLNERGLSSQSLDEIEIYIEETFGKRFNPQIGSIREHANWKDTYVKMLDFLERPESSIRGYKKYRDVISEIADRVIGGEKMSEEEKRRRDEIMFRLYDSGILFEMFHLFGNSPEIEHDVESLIDSGVDYNDILTSFNRAKKAVIFGNMDAYYMFLRDAKMYAEQRRRDYENTTNK